MRKKKWKEGDDPIHLTQAEAVRLMEMGKHCLASEQYVFPTDGAGIRIPIVSEDRRHEFVLDVCSKRLNLKKYTFGNRTKNIVTLVRVDLLEGGRHINPDHTEITGPHIHEYREGYGDKWARPLPSEFGPPDRIFGVFQHFMDFCRIVTKPTFSQSLFMDQL